MNEYHLDGQKTCPDCNVEYHDSFDDCPRCNKETTTHVHAGTCKHCGSLKSGIRCALDRAESAEQANAKWEKTIDSMNIARLAQLDKIKELVIQLQNIRAGHTKTVEYDLSPAMTESLLRDKLIELGWIAPEANKELLALSKKWRAFGNCSIYYDCAVEMTEIIACMDNQSHVHSDGTG